MYYILSVISLLDLGLVEDEIFKNRRSKDASFFLPFFVITITNGKLKNKLLTLAVIIKLYFCPNRVLKITILWKGTGHCEA
jgi:hypothetical protein